MHTFNIYLCWWDTPVSEEADSEKERQWEKGREREKERRVKKEILGEREREGGGSERCDGKDNCTLVTSACVYVMAEHSGRLSSKT